ncbi:MAG: CoA pyrophosphatase [Acidobacteriota bacterium]
MRDDPAGGSARESPLALKPVVAFPDQIQQKLLKHSSKRIEHPSGGRAAVLMPIFQKNDEPYLLLTLRTEQVETHKGQVSFPGGVQEPRDSSLEYTALRETEEEIGLSPENVRILGDFDEYLSVTDLVVRPFVGWIEMPVALKPNPDEVAAILEPPLHLFRDESRVRVEKRVRRNEERLVYFYDFNGQEIWGLTAQIIRDFVAMLDGREH